MGADHNKTYRKFVPFMRNHKAIMSRLRMLRRYNGDPGRPNIIHMAITDKCNMNCPNCLYRNDNKNFRIISAARAESLIIEINSPVILLSGGEPLLGGEILETTRRLARFCRESGRITGVLTNGLTLDSVVKKDFPEFRPGSKFFFQISIDGMKDEHDRLRGHFDKIMNNIHSAKEAGHLIYTNTVVGRENVNTLNETVRFISGFSDRIYLNPMVGGEHSLDTSGLEALGNFIVDHQDVRIGNSVNFGKFLKGERKLKCMFHSLISITPTGKIKFPCYCYGEGSEYIESFREFLQKVDALKKYYEQRLSPQCRTCYTHCVHEAHVYAKYYWNEILEQVKRPGCLYKKYIEPVYKRLS